MRHLVRLIFLFTIAVNLIASPVRAEEKFGEFVGEVVAKFMRDGRNMQLERPFSYIDPRGLHWDVPAGAVTDGASIPRFFWVCCPPFTGKYREAAVIHDYYCQTMSRDWRETHRVFYDAMRAGGVDELMAKTMYGAVYYFGPRWGIEATKRRPVPEEDLSLAGQDKFFKALNAWIERDDPKFEDIDTRLDFGDKFH